MSHPLLLARSSEALHQPVHDPHHAVVVTLGILSRLEAECAANDGTGVQHTARGSATSTADLEPKRLRPTIGLHLQVSWR